MTLRRLMLLLPLGLLLAGSFCQTVAGKDALPGPLASVGIDQKLDAQVPLDAEFVDDTGRAVALQEYFGTKPVVLSLVYFECPMLCKMVNDGLVRCLRAMKLEPGKDFQLLSVSFNSAEGPRLASDRKKEYVRRYNRAGADKGWHYLTGKEPAIEALTAAVGFRYKLDEETRQFAHSSTLIVLTPEGRVSRYFPGVEYAPRDLRLGLVEASKGKIGEVVDHVLLFCFNYDPATGKYGLAIMRLLRVAGILTVLIMAAGISRLRRQERQSATSQGNGAERDTGMSDES